MFMLYSRSRVQHPFQRCSYTRMSSNPNQMRELYIYIWCKVYVFYYPAMIHHSIYIGSTWITFQNHRKLRKQLHTTTRGEGVRQDLAPDYRRKEDLLMLNGRSLLLLILLLLLLLGDKCVGDEACPLWPRERTASIHGNPGGFICNIMPDTNYKISASLEYSYALWSLMPSDDAQGVMRFHPVLTPGISLHPERHIYLCVSIYLFGANYTLDSRWDRKENHFVQNDEVPHGEGEGVSCFQSSSLSLFCLYIMTSLLLIFNLFRV